MPIVNVPAGIPTRSRPAQGVSLDVLPLPGSGGAVGPDVPPDSGAQHDEDGTLSITVYPSDLRGFQLW